MSRRSAVAQKGLMSSLGLAAGRLEGRRGEGSRPGASEAWALVGSRRPGGGRGAVRGVVAGVGRSAAGGGRAPVPGVVRGADRPPEGAGSVGGVSSAAPGLSPLLSSDLMVGRGLV